MGHSSKQYWFEKLVKDLDPRIPIRVRTDDRQRFLLKYGEVICVDGENYKLCWKNLGSGIWELSFKKEEGQ